MRDVPECLNRRYKAVDDLIQQLSWSIRTSGSNTPESHNEGADPGIKLMCDFWNILKEDPNCDLKRHVKQRMGLTTPSTHKTYPQELTCYNVVDKDQSKWKDCAQKLRNLCCQKQSKSKAAKEACSHCKMLSGHCQRTDSYVYKSNNASPAPRYHQCKSTNESPVPKTPQSVECCGAHPLGKALNGVNEAATFESQCNDKINDLIITQLKLAQQIEVLETRESDGIKLMKKADCMWSCMEESYTKRLQEATDRQNNLIKQKKVANMTSEIGRLQKLLKDEYKNKMNKEQTGNRFVKEARQELQKICRVLLKKRLGNEDRRAEKAALLEEINLLNVTMDQCKDRCKLKQDNLSKDIAKLDEEIATYKMKCIQCNKCTDSQDISRFCTDCPRCINDRDCVYKDDYCIQDSTTACVCMSVKEKFLDNVFDNMYTVLERNSKNPQGKLVAEAILNCLKHSRDGKLNTDTKKLVQNFILGTVKKNLNLTIVGGAVKTRCEMEPETYQQLLLCLKKVNPEKIPKEKVDKGTEKKDPCRHWGGRVSECHCPNGPKECVCKQKAPKQPPPPQPALEDKAPKDDIKPGEVLMCPHKESVTCGPDCGASDASMKVGAEMSKWIPDPCSGPACSFKSVRAVQCVLGPEVLNKPKATTLLPICAVDILDNRITNCSKSCITDNLVSKENLKLKKTGIAKFRNAGKKLGSESDRDNKQYFIIEAESLSHTEKNDKMTITSKNEHHHSVVKKEKLTNMKTNDMAIVSEDYQQRSVVQKEKLSHMKQNNNSSIGSKATSNGSNKTFITKLSRTSSGALAISLDDEATHLIDEKAANEFNSVSLNKTPSGHFYVDFNDEHDTTDDTYKAFVTKSPSDTRTLEVFKNKSKTKDINNKISEKTKANITNSRLDKEKEITTAKKENLRSELLKSLVTNLPVDVRVTGANGPMAQIQSLVTKTLSGNLAIDIQELSLLGENLNASGRPVILNVLKPGLFDLSISKHNRNPNAVVWKNHSGKVLVVLKKPDFKPNDAKPAIEEYLKLKIRSRGGIEMDAPVVLKVTTSFNHVVIFDKEFEKECKKLIEDFVKNNVDYHINFTKTSSGSYLIRLDDYEKSFKSNALFVRSSSGSIKILTKFSKRNNPKTAGSNILKEIFSNIPRSVKDFATHSKGTAMECTKSRSASNLCDFVSELSLEHRDLKGNPLTALKKTNSGQYAVVLRKESKKAFLKYMKSYLQNDSKGLIPVKRTESGEIMIMLSEDMKANTGKSLKITSSGSVYITVDENLVKDNASKTLNKEEQTSNKTSAHVIGNLKRPVNRAVATSYNNRKPDSAHCDFASSNCVCTKALKLGCCESSPNYNGNLYGRLDPNEVCDCLPIVSIKKDSPNSDQKRHGSDLDQNVTRPRISKPVLKNNPRSIEQCFYSVSTPLTTFYFNEKIPNNLIDVSIICKKRVQTSTESEHWDSIGFLAPQLPVFLRGLKYE